MRVHIIQPSVPPYRKTFFEYLSTRIKADIFLYTSPLDEMASRSVEAVNVASYYCKSRFIRLPFSVYFQCVKPELRHGDVLVINGNPRMLSNYLLIALARSKKVPVVWWGHGWSPTSKPWRAWLRKALTKRLADAVLLYTDTEKATYLADGFDEMRVFALNNGANVELIDTLRAQALTSSSVSKEWEVLEEQLTTSTNALFIGRLTRKSGVDTLVKSFAEVDPNVGLIVVGAGEIGEEVSSLIQSMGLSHRIIMVGAAYDEPHIAYWMTKSHLFVYPGSVGLSVIHALAYALPVVIHSTYSEHGPESTVVEDGVNGFVFEQGSTESMVASINRLACHQNRATMGERGRAKIVSDYSFDVMVLRFTSVIDFVSFKESPDNH